MAIYDNLPYTNFHELNADWLLKQMKEAKAKIDEYQEVLDQFEEDYQALLALANAMTVAGSNVTVAGSLTANGLIGNLTGNATHATDATHATNAAIAAGLSFDTSITSTDMNDYKNTTKALTMYHISSATSNVPLTSLEGESAIIMYVGIIAANYGLQFAYFDQMGSELFVRILYGNAWQHWKKITTTNV